MIDYLVWAVLLFLALPILVYLCVKLGTIAYLRARDGFEHEEKGEKHYGDN